MCGPVSHWPRPSVHCVNSRNLRKRLAPLLWTVSFSVAMLLIPLRFLAPERFVSWQQSSPKLAQTLSSSTANSHRVNCVNWKTLSRSKSLTARGLFLTSLPSTLEVARARRKSHWRRCNIYCHDCVVGVNHCHAKLVAAQEARPVAWEPVVRVKQRSKPIVAASATKCLDCVGS